MTPKLTTFRNEGKDEEGWIITPSSRRKNKNFYMLQNSIMDFVLKHHLSPAGMLMLFYMMRNAQANGRIRKWSTRNISKELGISYFRCYAGIQDLRGCGLLNDEDPLYWQIMDPNSASKY